MPNHSLLSHASAPPEVRTAIFFLVAMLHVTPNGLSERGTTRSLDTSKGEVFRVVHVWKFYFYFILFISFINLHTPENKDINDAIQAGTPQHYKSYSKS